MKSSFSLYRYDGMSQQDGKDWKNRRNRNGSWFLRFIHFLLSSSTCTRVWFVCPSHANPGGDSPGAAGPIWATAVRVIRAPILDCSLVLLRGLSEGVAGGIAFGDPVKTASLLKANVSGSGAGPPAHLHPRGRNERVIALVGAL